MEMWHIIVAYLDGPRLPWGGRGLDSVPTPHLIVRGQERDR